MTTRSEYLCKQFLAAVYQLERRENYHITVPFLYAWEFNRKDSRGRPYTTRLWGINWDCAPCDAEKFININTLRQELINSELGPNFKIDTFIERLKKAT